MKTRVIVVLFFVAGCSISNDDDPLRINEEKEMGGSRVFKVPVPKGYDWEVTQSWKEHCDSCNEKGYSWDYCSSVMSHTWSCCKYAWDFNLPLNGDDGKPVLASFDGYIEDLGFSEGWGNYVVINHGHNICTRYAHMQDGSISHLYQGMEVCQGLVVGKIGNTGASEGHHLHFHFEDCDNPDVSVKRSFGDGNGIPSCRRGDDIYDSSGNYNFLKLTNTTRYSCDQIEKSESSDFDSGGWKQVSCGHIGSCPLNNSCGRGFHHQFPDYSSLSGLEAKSAAYLYGECALDGKADGKIHANDYITRAEALKISLVLFDLLDNCGQQSYFADVDESDWFFGVVACAVRRKLVTDISTYFRPNEPVTMDEAVEYLVAAANYRGSADKDAIDALIKASSGGNKVRRGDFFVMASSLSPCFCPNVQCGVGCSCDQESFSCINPYGNEDEYGGSEQEQKSYDLVMDCFVVEEKNRCEMEKLISYVKCRAENNDETIRIDDILMSLVDSKDMQNCTVIDETLHKGVGYFKIEQGEKKLLPGHFEVLCEDVPNDGKLDFSFDLVVKEGKNSVVHSSYFWNEVDLEESFFTLCQDHTASEWSCENGYIVSLYSPGGSFEIVASGPTPNYSSVIPEGMHMKMTFDCIDLPAVIRFNGGPEGLSVIPESSELVMLDIWAPYNGPLTLSPEIPFDIKASSFSALSPNMTILVKIPK